MTYFINRKVAHWYVITNWLVDIISQCIILIHSVDYIHIYQIKCITIWFSFDNIFGYLPYNCESWCDCTSICISSPSKHMNWYVFITPSVIRCWEELYINQVSIIILETFKLTYIPQFYGETKSENYSTSSSPFTLPFAHCVSIKRDYTVD